MSWNQHLPLPMLAINVDRLIDLLLSMTSVGFIIGAVVVTIALFPWLNSHLD